MPAGEAPRAAGEADQNTFYCARKTRADQNSCCMEQQLGEPKPMDGYVSARENRIQQKEQNIGGDLLDLIWVQRRMPHALVKEVYRGKFPADRYAQ